MLCQLLYGTNMRELSTMIRSELVRERWCHTSWMVLVGWLLPKTFGDLLCLRASTICL